MVPQQVPRAGAWMWVTTEGVPGLQQLEDSLKLLPAPRSRVAHPCLALGGSYTAAQESVHLDGAGQEHPAGGERRCGMKESLPAEHHYHPPPPATSDHVPLPVLSEATHTAGHMFCSSTSRPRPEFFPLPKILLLPDILKKNPFISNQTLPPHRDRTPWALTPWASSLISCILHHNGSYTDVYRGAHTPHCSFLSNVVSVSATEREVINEVRFCRSMSHPVA